MFKDLFGAFCRRLTGMPYRRPDCYHLKIVWSLRAAAFHDALQAFVTNQPASRIAFELQTYQIAAVIGRPKHINGGEGKIMSVVHIMGSLLGFSGALRLDDVFSQKVNEKIQRITDLERVKNTALDSLNRRIGTLPGPATSLGGKMVLPGLTTLGV